MLTLDVGCGQSPQGNVNCDLYPGSQGIEHRSGVALDVKLIPNFVKCTIHNLPFKSCVFDKVHCSHVLEHEGVMPLKSVKELVRVLKLHGLLEIVVPHRFARISFWCYKQHKCHVRYFNATTLIQLFAKVGIQQVTGRTTYRYYPHSFFPIIRLPLSVYIKGWKRKRL